MQTIEIKKFGNVLVSRPAGMEAFNAMRPSLDPEIPVQIDFSNVLTVTPSWLDEFLTRLVEYMQAKVEILPTDNASVLATLPILGTARKDKVADIINKALAKIGTK